MRVPSQYLNWWVALGCHVLVAAISVALDDGIIRCAQDISKIIVSKSVEAEQFFDRYPIDLSSEESFRESRERWHVNFKHMITSLDMDLFEVIGVQNETDPGAYYNGPCADVRPNAFMALDIVALSFLSLVFLVFLWQDARTPFGADREVVFVSVNIMIAIFIFLIAINMPLLGLIKVAVRLSKTLQGCLTKLKVQQRDIIGELPFEEFHLRANVWDGQRFGVKEPFFGFTLDEETSSWFKRRLWFCLATEAAIVLFLVYRASVKSLMRWRRAIPSVVCIGVVFPDEDRLRRLGSGCIVDSEQGLVLTNWHLFQHFYSELDPAPRLGYRRLGGKYGSLADQASRLGEPVGTPKSNMKFEGEGKESATEAVKNNKESRSMDQLPSFITAAVGNTPEPSRIHRHTSSSHKRAISYADKFPGMRIFIGTAERGHPMWQYEASFTGVESPSVEYAPFGLDLQVLHITKKVKFEDLVPHKGSHGEIDSSYTYTSVSSEDIQDVSLENLPELEIGDPSLLRSGDAKLRLLGYPASGGYELSVLAGFLTSTSFDYPNTKHGAWLNINIVLPHGGSGGAAVNADGQLVGICTQTKGELTNIRSIREAEGFISQAEKEVKLRKAKTAKPRKVSSFGESAEKMCKVSSQVAYHVGLLHRCRQVIGF